MIARALIISGASLLTLGGCAAGQPSLAASESARSAELVPDIRVDERIELLAIIFRLAGAEEYGTRFVPDYADAIDAHFERFRDHPAVLEARELRRSDDISYNAVVDLAVQLGPLPQLEERVPLENAELDPRWKPRAARAFLEKVRAFATDTDAAAFFTRQQPLYEVAERRMRNLIGNETDLRWIQNFYGGSDHDRFIVVPALGNGRVAYGPRFFGLNGERELYAVVNVTQTDEDGRPAFGVGNASLLVHEFGHSYVNPLVMNDRDLAAAGDLLIQTFKEQMSALGYERGPVMIHESIIRAGVARYKRAHVGDAAARKELDRQRFLGFLWIDELYELLGKYEQDRAHYPTFTDFYPEVRKYFTLLGPRLPSIVAAYDAQRPKVVEVTPANGSQGVDPSLNRITVRFDRPMQQRWGLLRTPQNAHLQPETAGLTLDESYTLLTIKVRLEPDKYYELPLITSGEAAMRSREGIPLAPFVIKLRTGPAKIGSGG